MRQSPPTRAALTRNPLQRFDGRSADGRLLRDLYQSYMNSLGDPTDAGTQAMVLSAVEQVVGAEKVRVEYFAGKVLYDEVIRAEGAANRALRRLGLNKPATAPRLSYVEKIEAREAAQRAAEGRAEADRSVGTEAAVDSDEPTGAAGAQPGEAA
jgi:hypothetical protein